MCMHPEYLDKLREEALEVRNSPLNVGNHEMPYLDSFIRETARLSPSLTRQSWTLHRHCPVYWPIIDCHSSELHSISHAFIHHKWWLSHSKGQLDRLTPVPNHAWWKFHPTRERIRWLSLSWHGERIIAGTFDTSQPEFSVLGFR